METQTKSIKELGAQYVAVRDRKRELAIQEENLNNELAQLESEMIPLLEELDAQNINIAGVGTIYLQSSSYPSIVSGKTDEVITWLDSNGLGHLAKRTVHHKTLGAEYKRWENEDLPLPSEELVKVFRKTEVRVRGEKSNGKE